MKRLLSLLALAYILTGCSDLLNRTTNPEDSLGAVTITIGGGEGGRTLLPEEFGDFYYELTFTSDSADKNIVRPLFSARSVQVNLLPGKWTVDIKGFLTEEGAEAVVAGSEDFSVESDKDISVTIKVRPIMENLPPQNENGTLALSVRLPPRGSGTFEIRSLDEAVVKTGSWTEELTEEITLAYGFYHVRLRMTLEGKEKTWRELAHIYGGRITRARKEFKQGDFNGDISAGITQFDMKGIDRDDVIINQEAKTITVFVPADAGFTLTPAIIFNGAMIEPAPGDPVDFSDSANNPVRYTIYTEGGSKISYSVTVKTLELIGISIESGPAKREYNIGESLDMSGLVIKAAYNSGARDSIKGGDSALKVDPYNFSSPGKKTITVRYGGKSAKFTVTVRLPGIIINDDDLLIIDEGHAVFNVPSIVLDRSRGDAKSFTFDEPARSVIAWRAGNIKLGSDKSVTLNAKAFNPGNYTLTLEFIKNNKRWLASLDFTVTE